MSLDDVWKYEVGEIHGHWQVMNSKLFERKTEKQEIQMLKFLTLFTFLTFF